MNQYYYFHNTCSMSHRLPHSSLRNVILPIIDNTTYAVHPQHSNPQSGISILCLVCSSVAHFHCRWLAGPHSEWVSEWVTVHSLTQCSLLTVSDWLTDRQRTVTLHCDCEWLWAAQPNDSNQQRSGRTECIYNWDSVIFDWIAYWNYVEYRK